MGVLDGVTIGPDPGNAPRCPTCGEPATGWTYTARSGYHLTPCDHYIRLSDLHELRALPDTVEVSGGSPAYPKRSQMTWTAATVTVPAGSGMFAALANENLEDDDELAEVLDETSTGNPDGVPLDLPGFLTQRLLEDAQTANRAIGRAAMSQWPARVLDYVRAVHLVLLDHMTVHDLIGQIEQQQPDPCTCQLVRLLAAPYAGHPEYRDEWRPTP